MNTYRVVYDIALEILRGHGVDCDAIVAIDIATRVCDALAQPRKPDGTIESMAEDLGLELFGEEAEDESV